MEIMITQTEKEIDYSAVLPQPPVFVVGYMHSGTTLLVSILKNHSSTFSANGETKYFMHLPIIQRTFPNLEDDNVLKEFVYYVIRVVIMEYNTNKPKADGNGDFSIVWLRNDKKRLEAIMADAKNNRDHKAIFTIVSNHIAQSAGKSRWVEKTPTHIFHIEEIEESVPNALFIEIVRDPRDILASKKTRRSDVWTSKKYIGNRKKKNLEKAFDPFWDSLSWKSAIRAGQTAKEKYPGRVHRIRYEDLVEKPEKEIRQMCSFLNIKFEPEMLNIKTHNSAEDNRSPASESGIVNTSVGRWQDTLNASEAMMCQWVLSQEMEYLEYKRTKTSAKSKLKIPVLLLKSGFEFILRSYRRLRLGGWVFFQTVFANYWKRFQIAYLRRN